MSRHLVKNRPIGDGITIGLALRWRGGVQSRFNCCLEVDVVWLGSWYLQAGALLQGGLRQSAVITRAAAIERNRHMWKEGEKLTAPIDRPSTCNPVAGSRDPCSWRPCSSRCRGGCSRCRCRPDRIQSYYYHHHRHRRCYRRSSWRLASPARPDRQTTERGTWSPRRRPQRRPGGRIGASSWSSSIDVYVLCIE